MKKFIAQDHISALNIFRISKDEDTFTKKELKAILKDSNIPSNDIFISALRRTPILVKVEKDVFKFANPKQPIYWKWLDKTYQEYKSKTSLYYNNSLKKKAKVA